MKRRRYTLVLGGGGMKGIAHVGVLLALEKHAAFPVEVVGSSVGSLVAGAWCAGMPAVELRTLALDLRRRDLFRIAHRDMAVKRMRSPAIYRSEPLRQLVTRLLGDITFDELPRPLLVNSVNLASGRQVLWGSPGLSDIPVADAILASCALPGYLPPHEIRGEFFIDGAAVSNLPVAATASRDRDLIMAIDVGSTAAIRPDTHAMGFAAVYARAIEFGIQTMRTATLLHWSQPPLLLIQPNVQHVGILSFHRNRELVAEGYRATTEMLADPHAIPPRGASGVYPRQRYSVRVIRERCIGCGACRIHGPPGLFALDHEGRAVVTQPEQTWNPIQADFIRQCPTKAIVLEPDEKERVSAA
ncbi:MAG: patatin-like phospholipase family protein [Gemmatimonadota bacterium]|nr:patatin-like phospholipase family protein [Gemmatimonadota bacterium]